MKVSSAKMSGDTKVNAEGSDIDGAAGALVNEGLAKEGVVSKKRGRPSTGKTRVMISMRVDADVAAALRATGRGWQTRLNALFRVKLKNNEPPFR
jgi:uncharacterized protein (DUF4415 family)